MYKIKSIRVAPPYDGDPYIEDCVIEYNTEQDALLALHRTVIDVLSVMMEPRRDGTPLDYVYRIQRHYRFGDKLCIAAITGRIDTEDKDDRFVAGYWVEMVPNKAPENPNELLFLETPVDGAITSNDMNRLMDNLLTQVKGDRKAGVCVVQVEANNTRVIGFVPEDIIESTSGPDVEDFIDALGAFADDCSIAPDNRVIVKDVVCRIEPGENYK